MTTLIVFHEVEDGQAWASAWQKNVGSRHQMFAQINVTARTFRDSDNKNLTGVILDVPDMEQFKSFMESDEAQNAMQEDGIKIETLRILNEFTP
jgi:hypothetical protein